MQRASASRKSSSKKSVTLLARGMKGDVKHGANYRFKVVLFGANCWKSQKSSSPTPATFIPVFKRIFEYIRIFEYFTPNIDIRIRFVVILNAEYYLNISSKYFRILVFKNRRKCLKRYFFN